MIMEIGRYKDTRRILPETLKEIENMEQLVKEILSISKLEMNTTNHTELLSLSNILKRVYKHLIPLANEKHIRIQKNISEDVIMILWTAFSKSSSFPIIITSSEIFF